MEFRIIHNLTHHPLCWCFIIVCEASRLIFPIGFLYDLGYCFSPLMTFFARMIYVQHIQFEEYHRIEYVIEWTWVSWDSCDVPFRRWTWHLHGFISWSTGQPTDARGNDWQTTTYISSKADGEKELEFSQSICCYGFCILSCWMCCWEGLMDLIIWGMEIYVYNMRLILLTTWALDFFFRLERNMT